MEDMKLTAFIEHSKSDNPKFESMTSKACLMMSGIDF